MLSNRSTFKEFAELTIASEGDNITKVVIILNDKGTLIGVQVLSAFCAAAPFPNPSKGIVEEDGTIKIRWNFVLEASLAKT